MPAVHSFQLPHLTVQLSLGHKYNGWYLLFAHPYRTADSREVARLDTPDPSDLHAPHGYRRRDSFSPRPRFWFSPTAASGWENGDGQTLLDLLLSLDLRQPPLFAVVDRDAVSGTRRVEVLLPEDKLAHYCEGCGRWESVGDKYNELRWFMVRDNPGALPGYLCLSCHSKDWFGAWAKRYLKRIFCS